MEDNGKLTDAGKKPAEMGPDYELHEKLVRVLADAWTKLDATELLKYIHPEFQYDSQWVLASMMADKYPEYITKKFENIKKTDAKPIVEIVPDNALSGSMVSLNQNGNPAFLRIECKDGKICKMDMCMF